MLYPKYRKFEERLSSENKEVNIMKIVLKAQDLIYSVIDAEGAVEAIAENNSKADAWLVGAAYAVEKMVDEIVNDDDFVPDMTNTTFDEHAYLENGEGKVWEYKGKRASDIDTFLPLLKRDLIREINRNIRKHISVRIKQNALDDAYDALSDLTHDKLSEIQCMRVIVESLTFDDWQQLVERHKDALRREVRNVQTESRWTK